MIGFQIVKWETTTKSKQQRKCIFRCWSVLKLQKIQTAKKMHLQVLISLKVAKNPNSKENEPLHDKTNKMSVCPAKTQISLGICPVWSESSLSAWRKLGSLATHLAHSNDSGQTGRMPRLTWVFAGHTATLLVLSCRDSKSPSGVCQSESCQKNLIL